nr:MAG TPA: ParB protein [Caudoviricetes sp.]
MKVVTYQIADVKPYENNPRNNDSAVDAVAASIREFGWQQPIVVDKDGVIIAGHTRYKAARKLGLTEVPVVVADNLTEEQTKAYRLSDNKTGELAKWDFSALEEELSKFTEIDMEQFGFSQEESVFDLLENDENGDVMSLRNDDLVSDYFDVTFVFKKIYESQIKDYIKENGKTPLIEAILRETGGCSK